MKIQWIGSFFIASLVASNLVYADDKNSFPTVNWVSKSSSDKIVIQNGAAAPLLVQIIVDPSKETDPTTLSIVNCGSTTSLSPGSVAICRTSTDDNPITFSSNSGVKPVSGTYQIREDCKAGS